MRRQSVVEGRYAVLTAMVLAHGRMRAAAERKTWRIRAALHLVALSLGTIVVGTAVDAVRTW